MVSRETSFYQLAWDFPGCSTESPTSRNHSQFPSKPGQWVSLSPSLSPLKERNTDFCFLGPLVCIAEKAMAPTPVFLPGESQGRGSLLGCHLWGRTELDTTEVT